MTAHTRSIGLMTVDTAKEIGTQTGMKLSIVVTKKTFGLASMKTNQKTGPCPSIKPGEKGATNSGKSAFTVGGSTGGGADAVLITATLRNVTCTPTEGEVSDTLELIEEEISDIEDIMAEVIDRVVCCYL